MIKTAFVSEQLYSLYFSRWPYIFVLGGQKNTNYDIMPAYASKYEIVQTVMFLPRERGRDQQNERWLNMNVSE